MSDLASSNDVATNGVNGRIGYKTWCKCECCAPMETSIEGVCCLEISEICKPRFSSTSSLNVCSLDPHFELWYSRWENVVSYLISTQCWSLANQNKSFIAFQTSWLSFSVKHFTLLMRYFSKRCFFGCTFFQKSIRLDSGGLLLLESNILSSESPDIAIQRCSRWLRIHNPYLKTRVALQILLHEARHKIPVKYLTS